MTGLGALTYCFGISADRNSIGLFLSQKKYALQLLERANMVHCNPSRTPIDTESKLGPDGVPVQDHTLHRSLVGGLQYLTFARPDLSYLLYAFATISLIGYTDADWAGCPSTRSAQVEYRGVANIVAEIVWLRNLLHELHSPLSTATLIYYDNVSAVYMSAYHVQHQRTKHIAIDIHFVRDMVTASQIWAQTMPRKNNIVKGLLFQSIPEDLVLQIGNLKTGKEMLEAIKTLSHAWRSHVGTQAGKEVVHIVEALEQVLDLKTTGFEDVVGRLKAYEERVKEEDKANDPQENLLYARTEYSNRNNDSSGGRGRGSYSRGRR
ncbi:ribonuclease H-like domain-containing protein [Tanacetum coccineum]